MRNPRLATVVAMVLLGAPALAQPTISTNILTASDRTLADGFGRAVAVSGTTILVGANGADARGPDSGAAYVFERNPSGEWVEVQKLVGHELRPGDFFGWSVAVDGDVAVVGAPGTGKDADVQPSDVRGGRGAAYVFQRVHGAWVQVQRIDVPDLVPGSRFGWVVAVSGGTLLVSAPGRGRVWSFGRTPAGWVLDGDLTPPDRYLQAFGFAAQVQGAVAVTADPYQFDLLLRRYVRPAGTWIPTNHHPWNAPAMDGAGSAARFETIAAIERWDDESLAVVDAGFTRGPEPPAVRRLGLDGRVTTLGRAPEGTHRLEPDGLGAFWIAQAESRPRHGQTVSRWTPGALPQEVAGGFTSLTLLERDGEGGVYVFDGCALRHVAPARDPRFVAGAVNDCAYLDGPAGTGRFGSPRAMTVASASRVLVGDGPLIRSVDVQTGQISTVAGALTDGPFPPRLDGVGTAARFSHITDVTVAPDGVVYLADGDALRRMTPAFEVTTIPVRFGESVITTTRVALVPDGNGLVTTDFSQRTAFRVTLDGVAVPLAGRYAAYETSPLILAAYAVGVRGNRMAMSVPGSTEAGHRVGGAWVFAWDQLRIEERLPAWFVGPAHASPFARYGTALTFTDAGDLALGPANGCVWVSLQVCADEAAGTVHATVVHPVRLFRFAAEEGWVERAALPSLDAGPLSGYGSTVASDDDVLVVGAPAWDYRPQEGPPFERNASSHGRVFVYDLATLDSDGDTMTDVWEERFGLNPGSAADAMTDTDGDGVSNAHEFLAHAHPRNDPAHTRYFAEGATSAFFETEYAVANPGDTDATVLLRYLPTARGPESSIVTVPAQSSRRVRVSTAHAMTEAEFSTVVESDRPVVVDRLMTWSRTEAYGSHGERALVEPRTRWYLAEGATHSGFDLFYLLQNATAITARVRVTYLRASGPPLTKVYDVAASSRHTIWVNTEMFEGDPATRPALSSAEMSAIFESLDGVPIAVERAMYQTGPPSQDPDWRVYEAGHASAGLADTAERWFFAEGAASEFFDTFILLGNPSANASLVRATYLLPDGRTFQRDLTLAPHSRFTVWVDFEQFDGVDGFPLQDALAVSSTIEVLNGVPIVAERAMWWPGPTPASWTEAHNSAGATQTATRWVMAAGQVSEAPARTDTYILVANPGGAEATVRVHLLAATGRSDAIEYRVPASSRLTIDVRQAFGVSGQAFGAVIESVGEPAAPIVVEWAVYGDAMGRRWARGANALATPWP